MVLRLAGLSDPGGHPGFGWFYNRQNVNQFLGFQEYWFTENHYGELVDPVEAQWNSDLLLVDEIVKDLRSCLDGEGRPVFSFSVSYQNHGPMSGPIPPTRPIWIRRQRTAGGVLLCL